MATLKDRTRFPPGSFQLLLPEIGMSAPVKGSFNEVVTAFAKIVKANPALAAKHQWPTERAAQENWIDEREAHRMIAGGFLGFVNQDGQFAPAPPGGNRRSGFAGAVAAGVSGLAIYRELFSGKSQPVAKDEAERRAAICTDCPQNRRGGFRDFFVAHVAKGLTELLGLMRDHEMTTTRDKELGTCAACDCPLFAKVHVELPTVLKHIRPEQTAKLDPRCWITQPPAGS